MSREAFMDAVARYWEAAYDEGMRHATHDTEDARAATALHEIKQGYDALAARLAEKEALLLNATMLLFDWDALVGGTGSHATETRDFLERVGYDPMTATLRKADSAKAVGAKLYRLQDKFDPYRFTDFDARMWNLIVVPSDQPSSASGRPMTADADPILTADRNAWRARAIELHKAARAYMQVADAILVRMRYRDDPTYDSAAIDLGDLLNDRQSAIGAALIAKHGPWNGHTPECKANPINVGHKLHECDRRLTPPDQPTEVVSGEP